MISKKSKIALSFLATLLCAKAQARDFYIKLIPEAATGSCLAEPQPDIADLINMRGIEVEGATRLELQALHRVLSTIERIGDGRFYFHEKAKFVFTKDMGLSNFDGHRINIRRNQGNLEGFRSLASHLSTEKLLAIGGTNNHALLAHELGHFIGHQIYKGQSLYQRFETRVEKCNISGYAKGDQADRHEEFAEVFAAYVTAPSHFLTDKDCADSFMFFSELFGEILPRPSCDYRIASVNRRHPTLSDNTFYSIPPQRRALASPRALPNK